MESYSEDDVYQTAPQAASGGVFQDAPGAQSYVGTGAADVLRVASGGRGAAVVLAPNGDVYLRRAGQTDVLRGIEAVRFSDGRLVFDPADPAESASTIADLVLAAVRDAWDSAVDLQQRQLGALGGGMGGQTLALAEAYPHLRFTVQDREQVIKSGAEVRLICAQFVSSLTRS